MGYTVSADNKHPNGRVLEEKVSTIVEAIDGAASAQATSDFINVRIEGNGALITGAAIVELWQVLHAPRS